MDLNEKKLSSKKVYECFFMKMYEDEVLLPNNEKSKRIYVKHDGAAAVLPITVDGKVILINQFRYPVNEVLIEIPAGKKDFVEESGLACAERELEEETGYKASTYKKIQNIYSCVGYSSEMIELFIAYDCEKVDNPLMGDDDEFIQVLEYTLQEVKELVVSGKVTDVKTLVALQYYLLEN